jgi:hypothetical protein
VISLTTISILIIISGVIRIQDPICEFSENDPIRKDENIKYILLWTQFFNSKNWWLKKATSDHRFFKGIGCPESRCVITNNRSLLPTLLFDAFVFHGAEHWTEIPRVRGKDQYYVFATIEPPYLTFHELKTRNNFFNWTSKMVEIITSLPIIQFYKFK